MEQFMEEEAAKRNAAAAAARNRAGWCERFGPALCLMLVFAACATVVGVFGLAPLCEFRDPGIVAQCQGQGPSSATPTPAICYKRRVSFAEPYRCWQVTTAFGYRHSLHKRPDAVMMIRYDATVFTRNESIALSDAWFRGEAAFECYIHPDSKEWRDKHEIDTRYVFCVLGIVVFVLFAVAAATLQKMFIY